MLDFKIDFLKETKLVMFLPLVKWNGIKPLEFILAPQEGAKICVIDDIGKTLHLSVEK